MPARRGKRMVKDRTNRRRAATTTLLSLLFALVLVGHPFVTMAGEPAKGTDVLRDLVRESLERNPELASFRFTAEGLEQRVQPAGALPDPMLSLSLSNVPADDFQLDKEPMTSKDIGFLQAIPYPGKRSLKQEIARLSAVQGSDRVESMRNMIRFRVKRDFFLLMENREVTRLTEKNKALLGELLEVANSRYSVGKAPQQDLFKAQVEISRLEKMLIALRKKKVELVADLNTLRNRPVTDPVGLPDSFDVPEIRDGEAELLEMAKTSNPDLRREADSARQKEAALALARKQILPDFVIGGAYKVREDTPMGGDRPDFFSATVGITLPLWHGRKQDKEVEASVRDLSSAKSGYESALNAIGNRLKEIAADIAAQQETLSLFDTGLLPQARESVNSSRAAYEVGQVEFASVLLGQIALYQQEIDREKTAEMLRIRTSELELVLGKELF
jgi:outer membrane protein TolC